MSCRDARRKITDIGDSLITETDENTVETLIFGVDSKVKSDERLQNNLILFDWVVRNKVYPNFWGRNINGDNSLTKDEMVFLRHKACKILALCTDENKKVSQQQGINFANEIIYKALKLEILPGNAIFLEIGKNDYFTANYLRGFVSKILEFGFVPGFKADTDSAAEFDRLYSRCLKTDFELFNKCLVWAIAPSLEEYNRITDSHLISPDVWKPYAPSGIKRKDISLWQYGENCHPIDNDDDVEVSFNINLVRNKKVFLNRMF